MFMRVFIGSDHCGVELKEKIKQILRNLSSSKIVEEKIKIFDVGTDTGISTHYPIYAKRLVKKLRKFVPFKKDAEQKNFGILICATGIGMSMVANRYKRIRAGLCHNEKLAEMTRKHNNANVLCIGAQYVNQDEVNKIVVKFLTTKFEGGRHAKRIKMF